MKRTATLITLAVSLGLAGLAFSQPHENGEHAKVIATYELAEKVDGGDATVTAVEVTIGPGQAGVPHRHPGPAFVYVIEGVYELGIDDQPTKLYKAGQTFQEPAGRLHRVSRNPATSGNTRLIAFILHPRDAQDILTPEAHP